MKRVAQIALQSREFEDIVLAAASRLCGVDLSEPNVNGRVEFTHFGEPMPIAPHVRVVFEREDRSEQ